MKYETPRLEPMGFAVEAVCGSMKKGMNHADAEGDIATSAAYEADE